MVELVPEVVEGEVIEPRFRGKPLAALVVERVLGTLDEREDIAHAEHPGHEAIGLERLEILRALADADERDGHADHADHRQRGTTARIAVHLGENDAGRADPMVELTRALDGILAGHGVGDIEPIGGIDGGLDRLQFGHEVVVDVQAARGIDDERVEAELLGGGQAPLARETGSMSPAGS